jgi:excisionase family DNA binding protein
MAIGGHMTTWLNLDELAQYLKTPKSTLYKLARDKRFPAHKLGRSYRFDRDEVDSWIKGGGMAKPAPKRRRKP